MYMLPPPPPQKRWYGWQTLIGLSISHTLAGAGGLVLAAEAPELGVALIITGSVGHGLTGPIVHWAHGHVARGFASLGITLGIPSSITAIVIATGLVTDSGCNGDFCGADAIYIGFLSGWIATVLAPAVDVAVLSYDELPGPGQDRTRPAAGFRPVITGVVPMLGEGRTGLALAGQF
jgi:hypothetical protein